MLSRVQQYLKQHISVLILIGMLSACVTINIYFPAASAQKVADEIIDDVWQLKEGEQDDAKKVSPDGEAESVGESQPKVTQ